MKLEWSVPNHPLYGKTNSYEMLDIDRDQLFSNVWCEFKLESLYDVEVRVTAERNSGERIKKVYKHHFPEGMAVPKGIESSEGVWMIRKLLAVTAGLTMIHTCLWLDPIDGKWHLDTENIFREEEKELITRFINDYIWQSKLMNVWKPVIQDLKASEPSNELLDRLIFLPHTPFEEFGSHTEEFLREHLVAVDDIENTIVSMSYGKESLLTYGLLRKQVKPDQKLALGMTYYNELEKLPMEKLRGFSNAYRRETNRLQFFEENMPEVFTTVSNSFSLNNQDDFEVFNHHQQLYSCFQYLSSGRHVSVLGDEFEITIREKVILNGVEYPVYTFEYQQSAYMHAKWNYLMKELGLPYRATSKLYHLMELQIQWLGYRIMPNFMSFQTSCWYSSSKHKWCGKCSKCVRLAFMMDLYGIERPKELKHLTYEGLTGSEILNLDALNEPWLTEISEENLRAYKRKQETGRMTSEILSKPMRTDERHPRQNAKGDYLGLTLEEESLVSKLLEEVFG